MAKKQTKADKAFIDKISTLNISAHSAGHKHSPTCGCGVPLQHVGTLSGNLMGKEVVGEVYAHGAVPAEAIRQRERKPKAAPSDEQSFSA
jgi:hypothetical protein